MKRLLLIFAALPLLFGQSVSVLPACQTMNCYTASTGAVSLSSAATAATIQQPATAPFQKVTALKASVSCSVTCTVTRTLGGSKATATAGTVVQSPWQPFGPIASTLLFFTASNSSGGTTIDTTPILGGGTAIFDLSDVQFGPTANQNYTISVGSITGTVTITFYVGIQ